MTPTYISPDKTDAKESQVKEVLPNLKVSQFLEPTVFKVEEIKNEQKELENVWMDPQPNSQLGQIEITQTVDAASEFV